MAYSEDLAQRIREVVAGRKSVEEKTMFQRFTLAFDAFSARPDLAGRLDDGETTFGVEAKGEDDLLSGIAQADLSRAGFHLALFASAGVPSPDLVNIARQRGFGVLAV